MDKILPIPEGLQLEENSQGITISYRWYSHVVWFLIFFAFIWNGFLVGWMLADTPFFFKMFASIHVAVGIGLVWYIVCLFLNTTIIKITKHEITISHAPIPLPIYAKSMQLSRFDIAQVYVAQVSTTNKGNTTYSFELRAISSKNISKKLSINCDNYEKAIFYKRKIEQVMRIEPQPIEGEYLG